MLGINYRWSSIIFEERGASTLNERSLKINSYGDYDNVGAGDRAPDAPNLRNLESGQKTTLFDIINPARHIILIFVTDTTYGLAKENIKIVDSLPSDSTKIVLITSKEPKASDIDKTSPAFFDSKGYARTHFKVDPDAFTTVIIRPDGYIGGICKSAEGTKKYFSTIFDI